MILRQAQDERRLCYSYLENQVPFPEPAHAEPVEAHALSRAQPRERHSVQDFEVNREDMVEERGGRV